MHFFVSILIEMDCNKCHFHFDALFSISCRIKLLALFRASVPILKEEKIQALLPKMILRELCQNCDF